MAGAIDPPAADIGSQLSGGAIAGVAVGSVVALAVAVASIKKIYSPTISPTNAPPPISSPPPVLQRDCLNIKAVKTLFHATTPPNAQSILMQGFICGSNGIAGGGIYFAETEADAHRKAHRHGAMLMCGVEIGRQLEIQYQGNAQARQRMIDGGYDSVKVPRNGTEHVVYDPRKVKSVVWLNNPDWA